MVRCRRDARGLGGRTQPAATARVRVRRLAAVSWLLAAGLGPEFAGCLLERAGSLSQDCTLGSDCTDGSGCTRDTCGPDGVCEYAAFDGSAYLVQVPGDCQRLVCVAGYPRGLSDDTDLPANPCIDATCNAGHLTEVPKPEHAPCQLGGGSGSCEAGQCVVHCTVENAATVCDDQNSCTNDGCNLTDALCVHDPLDGQPAPGVAQIEGDCKVVLCVTGQQQVVADDADLNDDGNVCTLEACVDGQLSVSNAPEGSPCGSGLVCNASGVCVGCTTPAQCGDPTHCTTPTCDNEQCGVYYQAQGTEMPADHQDALPCQKKVCNGWGSSEYIATNDSCDDGLYCNGNTDVCIGGSCGGVGADPCAGSDSDADCFESCDEATDQCTAYDGDTAQCEDGRYCTGAGQDHCTVGGCMPDNPVDPCGDPSSDPSCDHSCDEVSRTCTAPDPDGTACEDGLFCTGQGSDRCYAGNCVPVAATDPCGAPSVDASCHHSCNEGSDTCTAPDPDGTLCEDGRFCTGQGSDHCHSGSCVADAEIDPCGPPPTDTDCSKSCDEAADSCTGPDPACTPCQGGSSGNGGGGASGGGGNGGSGGLVVDWTCDGHGHCGTSC